MNQVLLLFTEMVLVLITHPAFPLISEPNDDILCAHIIMHLTSPSLFMSFEDILTSKVVWFTSLFWCNGQVIQIYDEERIHRNQFAHDICKQNNFSLDGQWKSQMHGNRMSINQTCCITARRVSIVDGFIDCNANNIILFSLGRGGVAENFTWLPENFFWFMTGLSSRTNTMSVEKRLLQGPVPIYIKTPLNRVFKCS